MEDWLMEYLTRGLAIRLLTLCGMALAGGIVGWLIWRSREKIRKMMASLLTKAKKCG